MGQAGPVVIALRLKKNLRLMHEPPEGFAVDNPINVALKTGADVALRLGDLPSFAARSPHASGRDHHSFQRFALFPGVRHSFFLSLKTPTYFLYAAASTNPFFSDEICEIGKKIATDPPLAV
jgi:hypothetical protein